MRTTLLIGCRAVKLVLTRQELDWPDLCDNLFGLLTASPRLLELDLICIWLNQKWLLGAWRHAFGDKMLAGLHSIKADPFMAFDILSSCPKPTKLIIATTVVKWQRPAAILVAGQRFPNVHTIEFRCLHAEAVSHMLGTTLNLGVSELEAG